MPINDERFKIRQEIIKEINKQMRPFLRHYYSADRLTVGGICVIMGQSVEKGVKMMFTNKKHEASSFDRYIFLILIAFEILMSFTFLGYIHIPPISVTFAYIPILIAACILGPVQSTVMGVIFGAASMFMSTAYYVMPTDKLFSPLLSGNPAGSILLAAGSRTMFGLIAGLAFGAAKRSRHKTLWIGVLSLFSPITHALLVIGAMRISFPKAAFGYFVSPYLVISNIASSVCCVIITELLWRVYNKDILKTVKTAVDRSTSIPYADTKRKRILVTAFALFVVGMTLAAVVYFSSRMSYMLNMHNVEVSQTIGSDLIHLQIQFTAAMLSLNVISIAILLLEYQYSSYENFLGELDAVTSVLGRRIFLNCCERSQKQYDLHTCTYGWFLFLDIDRFKMINDTLGHTAGDNVLKDVAAVLNRTFHDYGLTGRMGGDEFAVMIDKRTLHADELAAILDGFLAEIAPILQAPQKVSCSIGACRFSFPADIALLMEQTDTLLYKAKDNGRAGYVLGEYE